MPPPRMTSRFGTSVCASRPVESTQRSDSSPGIGGRSGNEPVATIADLEGDVLAALDGDRVRVLERAGALDPLDAVRLEQARDAAGHLLDDAGLPLVRGAEVELRAVDLDAELRERARSPGAGSARSAPTPWSGCTRRAGTCRRARAPSRCRRPSRPAGLRGSLRCSHPGHRPGRRRRLPSQLLRFLEFTGRWYRRSRSRLRCVDARSDDPDGRVATHSPSVRSRPRAPRAGRRRELRDASPRRRRRARTTSRASAAGADARGCTAQVVVPSRAGCARAGTAVSAGRNWSRKPAARSCMLTVSAPAIENGPGPQCASSRLLGLGRAASRSARRRTATGCPRAGARRRAQASAGRSSAAGRCAAPAPPGSRRTSSRSARERVVEPLLERGVAWHVHHLGTRRSARRSLSVRASSMKRGEMSTPSPEPSARQSSELRRVAERRPSREMSTRGRARREAPQRIHRQPASAASADDELVALQEAVEEDAVPGALRLCVLRKPYASASVRVARVGQGRGRSCRTCRARRTLVGVLRPARAGTSPAPAR